MPAAAPVPRRPTVLTLDSAADLLTGPGCPVCRYAGEAGDRYLAWFALEGHAGAVTISRMCASLSMCARHTRALMSQPGAARRLTAVHRYLVRAARDRLADDLVRERYRELGGLCVPHLRAASARSTVVRRLVQCLPGDVAEYERGTPAQLLQPRAQRSGSLDRDQAAQGFCPQVDVGSRLGFGWLDRFSAHRTRAARGQAHQARPTWRASTAPAACPAPRPWS
jgi:hypothetical protein